MKVYSADHQNKVIPNPPIQKKKKKKGNKTTTWWSTEPIREVILMYPKVSTSG